MFSHLRTLVLLAALALLVPPLARPAGPGRPPARPDEPLPAGALLRLGTARFRHEGSVLRLAFSPDGKTLAALGYDQVLGKDVLRLWDAHTGKDVRGFRTPDGWVHAFAFSPDGKLLACAVGGPYERRQIVLREMPTGKELRRLTGHEVDIRRLAFSPEGRTLASASDDETVRLWDVRTGKELRRLPRRKFGYGAVAFSPDGKVLASCCGDGVLLWQAATGKLLRRLGRWGDPTDLAFAPDGKMLVVEFDRPPARLLDVTTGRVVREYNRRQGWGGRIALSPDGKVLVVGGWGEPDVQRWEVRTGHPLRSLPGHRNRYWNPVAFSPDGKLLATASSHVVRLWDASTGRERLPSAGHHGVVRFVAPSSDGRLLATGGESGTCLWNLRSGKLLQRLGDGGERTRALGFAPDGRTLVTVHPDREGGIWEGRVRFWSVVPTGRRALRRLRELKCPDAHDAVALSADLRVLVSLKGESRGRFSSILVCDARTGKGRRVLERSDSGDSPPEVFIALPSDGRVLAAGNAWGYERAYLWDTATGKPLPGVRLHAADELPNSNITSLALSVDGARLAVGLEQGLIEVWETGAPRYLHTLKAHKGRALALSFSPDGHILASGGQDRSVRLWETATGRQRHAFTGHEGKVLSLAWAQGGRMLVSGSADTTALVWDVWGTLRPGKPAPAPSPRQAEALWAELASPDAARAFTAARQLAACPDQAARLLGDRLRPAAELNPRRVARLLAELDSEDFAVRERATRELERLGEPVAPALRKALAGKPSPEARRRAARLLERLDRCTLTPEELRESRAVEVLEHAGGAGARRLLARLAAGAPGARLTQEARAALRRLDGRAGAAGASPGGRR